MRGIAICLVGAVLLAGIPQPGMAAPRAAARSQTSITVYDGQPEYTEDELLRFASTLPAFRTWCRQKGEQPHPSLRGGRPDFVYSAAAADWARFHGWDDKRFFCVMGRSAAALAQIMGREEGGGGTPVFRDMPQVSRQELELAQRHLGELLRAASDHPQQPGQTRVR